ncbi:MAG: hypothetical protein LBT23_09690 [Synergistaceae bacterium]|nr:hypothetical protein [Synergistaceae bacterium]
MDKFQHRHGLLKRAVAAFLAVAVLVSCFPAPPAEAFVEEIVAAIIIAACEAIAHFLYGKIEDTAEESLESIAKHILYEGLRIDQQRNQFDLEKKLYDLDHKALSDGMTFLDDISSMLRDTFSASYRSDGRNFTDSWNRAGFERATPGYRTPGASPVIFSAEYDRLVHDMTDDYVPGFALGNHASAADLASFSSSASVATTFMMNEALMEAGELTNGGYRQAAFEQAVGTWKNLAGATREW